MNNYTDIILKYRLGEMTIAERKEFNHMLALNVKLRKEFVFQEKLDKIMKKSLLLEVIESDPYLIKAEILASKDINNYLDNCDKKALSEVETEVNLRKKIAKAEVEMVLSGIDDISEVWVRNFEEGKPVMRHDLAAQQIIQYVKKSEPFKKEVVQMPQWYQRINRKVVLQLAAAVLVLSMLLIKSLIPSYSGDSVYRRYYEPLEANSFSLRGTSQDENLKLQEGVGDYLSKNYAKAEIAFNESRKMTNNSPEALLYAGLNKMGQDKINEAIVLFSDLLSTSDQFVPETQWYLALCYIKSGENLKAHSLLKSLSETEGIYMKKAQLILKNLNQ